MCSDRRRGRLIRSAGQTPVCPPKHVLTDAVALVNGNVAGASQIELYLVDFKPGGEGFEDAHPGCEHGFFVLSGKGEAWVEGERFELGPEDCLFIPEGARHSIKTLGEESLRTVVFMAPHR